jgi:hypothetical protein
MNWNIQWEPLMEMQVQAQVARLVEDVLRNPASNTEEGSKLAAWVPVVDLSNLRPN